MSASGEQTSFVRFWLFHVTKKGLYNVPQAMGHTHAKETGEKAGEMLLCEVCAVVHRMKYISNKRTKTNIAGLYAVPCNSVAM